MADSPISVSDVVSSDQLVVRAAASAFLGRYRGQTRVHTQSGCLLVAGDDTQVAYRLESDRPLEWVGEGLREVGIEPGTVLDDAGKAAAGRNRLELGGETASAPPSLSVRAVQEQPQKAPDS